MSVTAIAWAFTQDIPRNQLPELLALADNANDVGVCWVRVATIAAKTKTTERTVQRNIKALADQGLLDIIERRVPGAGNRCNLYLLPLPGINRQEQSAFIDELVTGTKPVRRTRGEGDTSVTQGVTPTTPRGDTSDTHNHKNEPTLKGSSTTAGTKADTGKKGPHRIPDDWEVAPGVRKHLNAMGFTDHQINIEAVNFRIYWQERSDSKARKASWGMTFINWVKRAGKVKPGPEGPGDTGNKPNRGNYGRPQSRGATGAELLGRYADQYEADSRSPGEGGEVIDGEWTEA